MTDPLKIAEEMLRIIQGGGLRGVEKTKETQMVFHLSHMDGAWRLPGLIQNLIRSLAELEGGAGVSRVSADIHVEPRK